MIVEGVNASCTPTAFSYTAYKKSRIGHNFKRAAVSHWWGPPNTAVPAPRFTSVLSPRVGAECEDGGRILTPIELDDFGDERCAGEKCETCMLEPWYAGTESQQFEITHDTIMGNHAAATTEKCRCEDLEALIHERFIVHSCLPRRRQPQGHVNLYQRFP